MHGGVRGETLMSEDDEDNRSNLTSDGKEDSKIINKKITKKAINLH